MSEPHEGTPAGDGAEPPTPPPAATTGWGAGYGRAPGYGSPPQASGHDPRTGAPQGGGTGAPGSGHQGSPSGAPPWGQPQYGAPQYGQPQYGGTPSSDPGGPSAFAPLPAQRGIVPLRPLGLGEIFDGAFRAIRANPRVMFGFSALIVSVAVAIGAVIQWMIVPVIAGAMSSVTADIDPSGQLVDSYALSFGTLGMVPFIALATVVLTGLLTGSVSRSVIGQTVTVGELWHEHWRRVLVLVAFTIVTQLIIAVAWGLLLLAVVLLATSDLLGLTVVVALLGGLLLLAATVWFMIRILLVPPALILEGTGIWPAIRHGWRLTHGSFWRILGIYLLTSVILGVISQIIVTPTAIVSMIVFPDQTSAGPIALTAVGLAISYTIVTVVTASVVALLYIDVRIRREGLDVELSRAAEAAARADAERGARP